MREGAGGRLTMGARRAAAARRAARGVDLTGVNGNWWLGLAVDAHALRARAQRGLRDARRGAPGLGRRPPLRRRPAHHRRGDGEDPHGRVDAPRSSPTPPSPRRCASNWYGLLGPRASRRAAAVDARRRPHRDPREPRCEDNGVPYSLTEEFVAVYRMHPLLPDEMALRNGTANGAGGWSRSTMTDVTGPAARAGDGVVRPGGRDRLVRPRPPRDAGAPQLPGHPPRPGAAHRRPRVGAADRPGGRRRRSATGSGASPATTTSAGCCGCAPSARSRS